MSAERIVAVGGPGFDPAEEHARQQRSAEAITRCKRALSAMDSASLLGVVDPEEYEAAAALLASIASRAVGAWCEKTLSDYNVTPDELGT